MNLVGTLTPYACDANVHFDSRGVELEIFFSEYELVNSLGSIPHSIRLSRKSPLVVQCYRRS